LRPESTELDHHNLSGWLGPVQPLRFLSRPRPAPTTGPAEHALHGPSCKPVAPRTTSTSGPRASSLRKILTRPLARTAKIRQGGPALHGPSRGPSDSDWPGSGQYRQPGRTTPGRPAGQGPRATPGPATARPRRALALHGPSRGLVTQIEPDWGPEPTVTTPPGRTKRARADSTNPVKLRNPGKAVSDSIHHPRSSADPRPATARPGGARAARNLPRAGAPD
jgi:hypothetical protein